MRRYLAIILGVVSFVVTVSAQPKPETVQYGEKDGQKLMLDHYKAVDVEGLRPCVMFVFGGAFHSGDRARDYYLPYFDKLTQAGYDVVSIDYRLGLKNASSEGDGMVAMIKLLVQAINFAAEDLYSATRYVLDHAAEWNIDATKIIASGSSAGAIACLQAENYICNGNERAKILDGFNYAGVISFAGAVFSASGAPSWKSEPCPMLLFHGNSDSNVPYNKASAMGVGLYGSELIYKQMARRNAPCTLYSYAWRAHEIAIDPMSLNIHEVLDFIERCVRGERNLKRVDVIDLKLEKKPTRFKVKDYLSSNYGA